MALSYGSSTCRQILNAATHKMATMAGSEAVIRRNGTVRRYNGGKSERVPLDAVEDGVPPSRNTPKPPRRKKRRASFSIQMRRWMLRLRSSQERLFECATAIVATALIAPYFVSLFLYDHSFEHSRANSPTRSLLQSTSQSHVSPKTTVKFHVESHFQLLFEHPTFGPAIHLPPEAPDLFDLEEVNFSDFGGLEFGLLEDESERAIVWDLDMETDYRLPDAPYDDDLTLYYAFDDDVLRDEGSRGGENADAGEDYDSRCRRTAEHRLSFPNCNSFHESPMMALNAEYLSEGAYRQVLVMDNPVLDQIEKIIIKDMAYDYDATHEHYEYVRMDAIVAERLTASPRIYDVYGLCGLGILSEFFPHGDIEDEVLANEGYCIPEILHDEDELRPHNNFTGMEKLEVALGMAEALADLHINHGGVIVHQDMQLSQYLWSADESILKLNDFNRAEFMLFDEQSQEYCRYRAGPEAGGNWRSPEEYLDGLLTEKIDVWSLGNNMYGVLTGLCPFYDEGDVSVIQRRIKEKETAYIDPRYMTRSPPEGKLAQIIEKCFAYDAADRPSIIEVVHMLRVAIKEVKADDHNSPTLFLRRTL